ncbi:ubiquitin-like protein ISG15 [Genypterus blacodes]|uniref:ubiquitin-like protein ISG15 n=1 Tax=Genypterus blacodes TaxID=154954 RepID=UPI003F7731F8
MDITVTMLNGTCRTLRVQPQHTVATLKKLIRQSLGFEPEQQTLLVDNGQRRTLNEDSKPLSFYGLHNGSTVSLLVTTVTKPAVVQVFVKNAKGETSTYDVPLDMGVTEFKKQVAERQRVAAMQIVLVNKDEEMQDGKRLCDHDVRAHSIIVMTFRLRGG